MRKIIVIASLLFCVISISYSQSTQNLSIKEIRSHVNNLATKLKSDGQLDEMYIKLDEVGKRWLYIEDKSLDGLRSDEGYISLKISKVILNMIYHSIYYNREETTSLKGFTKILENKSIKGVQYETHNNDFFFSWEKILNFDN